MIVKLEGFYDWKARIQGFIPISMTLCTETFRKMRDDWFCEAWKGPDASMSPSNWALFEHLRGWVWNPVVVIGYQFCASWLAQFVPFFTGLAAWKNWDAGRSIWSKRKHLHLCSWSLDDLDTSSSDPTSSSQLFMSWGQPLASGPQLSGRVFSCFSLKSLNEFEFDIGKSKDMHLVFQKQIGQLVIVWLYCCMMQKFSHFWLMFPSLHQRKIFPPHNAGLGESPAEWTFPESRPQGLDVEFLHKNLKGWMDNLKKETKNSNFLLQKSETVHRPSSVRGSELRKDKSQPCHCCHCQVERPAKIPRGSVGRAFAISSMA